MRLAFETLEDETCIWDITEGAWGYFQDTIFKCLF